MSRRKRQDPTIRWNIVIPTQLAAEIELLLIDPFLMAQRMGAKSELVVQLLQRWLADQRERQLQLLLEEPKPGEHKT